MDGQRREPEHRSHRREEKMFSISAMTATNLRQLKFTGLSRGNLWRRVDYRKYASYLKIRHFIVREFFFLLLFTFQNFSIMYNSHCLRYIMSMKISYMCTRNIYYRLLFAYKNIENTKYCEVVEVVRWITFWHSADSIDLSPRLGTCRSKVQSPSDVGDAFLPPFAEGRRLWRATNGIRDGSFEKRSSF